MHALTSLGRWMTASLFILCIWGTAANAEPLTLATDDCIKCHPGQVNAVFEDGEKHRTAVTCLDCHEEHPPKGADAIPVCAKCHELEANVHFAIETECLTCHQDPHRPLIITFDQEAENKPACLSCHPYQGQEMEDFPSAHAERDCSMCHTMHGTFEACLQCHEAHVEGMEYATCLRCHQPHKPTDITWQSDIPSSYCAGCHPEQVELQMQNKNKHGGFICVFCHRFGHSPGMLPECTTCHGMPHDRSFADSFPDCLTCHRDPHFMTL